jgi:sucrose-6-phosphate hydrolase SacC (GH32 family)
MFLSISIHARGADDIAIADFSGSTYGEWEVFGTAFGSGPASGALLAQLHIEHSGKFGVATSKGKKTDAPWSSVISPRFKIERRFISFLISGSSSPHNCCLNLMLDGRVVKSATGGLKGAGSTDRLEPDSWDVSSLLGKEGQIQILDTAGGGSGCINVASIVQTDHPVLVPMVKTPLYEEALRPLFHFTARQWTVDKLNPQQTEEGWLNDVNGPIYYDGEYHLFAQRWAKCWLHAVSPDLVHWTELEPAFWEATQGSGIQSGTCVIDYDNTSGLSPSKGTPAMVAFWSSWDNRTQNIAYSLDRGRSWKFYDKNPVLVAPERDPKVFWHAPTKSWVMILCDHQVYRIFTSNNLLNWDDRQSAIPNSHECPDFFQLAIDGDKKRMKWVLVRGNGRYSLGEFNGVTFTEESPQFTSDAGPHFYAAQTWENTITGDGRRIQIGWMQNYAGGYPNMPFNQQLTFPRALTLRTTATGPRLFQEPIEELALLHGAENNWPRRELPANSGTVLRSRGESFHIVADVSISEGATLTFRLCGAALNLTQSAMQANSDPKVPVSGELTHVEILVDRTSIEAFANHGEATLSRLVLPQNQGVWLECHGGSATLRSLKIFDIISGWKKAESTAASSP